jgi:hypothetical protein
VPVSSIDTKPPVVTVAAPISMLRPRITVPATVGPKAVDPEAPRLTPEDVALSVEVGAATSEGDGVPIGRDRRGRAGSEGDGTRRARHGVHDAARHQAVRGDLNAKRARSS